MESNSSGPQTYPMTVVIATLGRDSLNGTLDTLLGGSIVPSEILLCIPADEAHKVRNFSCTNVKVLATDCRGQVAQRAIGFRHASQDVVMQLDDDILVDEHCVERLLKTLRALGRRVAVAPSLVSLSTGESVYKQSRRNKTIRKIYYWLMNGSAGYQPGTFDKSGSAIGIDPEGPENELFDVEWLAGACILHYRENLVLDDFYPFEGKAYHEDVIHSYHLRRRGISLKVDSKARCWLKPVSLSELGHIKYLKHLVSDYRARKYSLQLHSRGSLWIYVFYLASYLSHVFEKAGGLKSSRSPKPK